jgi:Family of unknown function (DUF5684)
MNSGFHLSSEQIVFICLIAFIQIIPQWVVFSKAGQPGWACLIPFYNIYIMTKITGKPAIWTLWCIIPVVNIIFLVWLMNMMSKSFGHGEGFTAGLVLLGIVFWPILAFGKSKYLGPYGNQAAFKAYRKDFEFEQGGQQ